jgi:hypothetical protein
VDVIWEFSVVWVSRTFILPIFNPNYRKKTVSTFLKAKIKVQNLHRKGVLFELEEKPNEK